MATREQVFARINEAFQARRGGRPMVCWSCGGSGWSMSDRFYPLIGSDTPNEVTIEGTIRTFPTAALVCDTCGISHLINLPSLGLTLDELTPDDSR